MCDKGTISALPRWCRPNFSEAKDLRLHPFACPNCRHLLHFEERVCPSCAFTLGYDPLSDRFLFLGDNATTWRDADGAIHEVVVCANNNNYGICNWLVPTSEPTGLCHACRHNRTIPDLSVATVPERWAKIEAAKRRLIDTLLRLRLPLETRAEATVGQGLAFDFLYDPAAEEDRDPQVMTGHDSGVITLNLIEADDVARERIRREMGEPYRTLLGHFRHEVGHHYWSRLVEHGGEIECFRAVFGDERTDYQAAIQNHYGNGGAQSWTDNYVSAYATAHPWEDFAETFAHLLHMIDTLATIGGFGARLDPFPDMQDRPGPAVDFNPYAAATDTLVAQWIPFASALNAINRSMGQPDLYPFRLSSAIIAKLDYVNRLVTKAGENSLSPAGRGPG
jgi:hypothetical protein